MRKLCKASILSLRAISAETALVTGVVERENCRDGVLVFPLCTEGGMQKEVQEVWVAWKQRKLNRADADTASLTALLMWRVSHR